MIGWLQIATEFMRLAGKGEGCHDEGKERAKTRDDCECCGPIERRQPNVPVIHQHEVERSSYRSILTRQGSACYPRCGAVFWQFTPFTSLMCGTLRVNPRGHSSHGKSKPVGGTEYPMAQLWQFGIWDVLSLLLGDPVSLRTSWIFPPQSPGCHRDVDCRLRA